MSSEALIYTEKGSVAWLIHNRPDAMNSINGEMLELYEEYIPAIENNQNIRVLVITGSGKAFCAGADLKEVLASKGLQAGEADFLDRVCENVFDPLRNLGKPVIAALNGITMAGGLEIAMCADIVLAAESAQIADGHSNFGVYPGAGGAAVLPRLVPQNVANYMLMTGKYLTAAQMQTYGFVNEIHPDADLTDATIYIAELIATKSPVALRRMKEVARTTLDKTRDDALLHEQVMLRKHMRSYDMEEGLKAFSEKRKPEFEGR